MFRRALLRLGVAFGAYLGARAIGGAIARTVQWGTEIDRLANKTDINIRQLQKYNALFTSLGVSGQEFADLLNTMAERLNEFQRGDATAVDVFTALGLSATDATGRLKSAEQGLLDFIAAYNRLRRTDPTQATALLSELFGGGAALQFEPVLRFLTPENL